MTFRQVRFKLHNAGFRGISQRGNHAKFIKTDGDTVTTAILPHYTVLSDSVVSSVLRQAKLTKEAFDLL